MEYGLVFSVAVGEKSFVGVSCHDNTQIHVVPLKCHSPFHSKHEWCSIDSVPITTESTLYAVSSL